VDGHGGGAVANRVLERSEFQGVLAYSLTRLATTRPVQGVRVRGAAHSTMRTCAGCSARAMGSEAGAGRSGPEREIGHAASAWGDSEKLGVYQEPARRDSVPSFMLRPRLTSANQRVISR
jgi:hypothetical protein